MSPLKDTHLAVIHKLRILTTAPFQKSNIDDPVLLGVSTTTMCMSEQRGEKSNDSCSLCVRYLMLQLGL